MHAIGTGDENFTGHATHTGTGGVPWAVIDDEKVLGVFNRFFIGADACGACTNDNEVVHLLTTSRNK